MLWLRTWQESVLIFLIDFQAQVCLEHLLEAALRCPSNPPRAWHHKCRQKLTSSQEHVGHSLSTSHSQKGVRV